VKSCASIFKTGHSNQIIHTFCLVLFFIGRQVHDGKVKGSGSKSKPVGQIWVNSSWTCLNHAKKSGQRGFRPASSFYLNVKARKV
jgi:hypothetical protein